SFSYPPYCISLPFFYTTSATTEISTLSLHDAFRSAADAGVDDTTFTYSWSVKKGGQDFTLPGNVVTNSHNFTTFPGRVKSWPPRSEEHTSERQSLAYLVCRLLLEKKKNAQKRRTQR